MMSSQRDMDFLVWVVGVNVFVGAVLITTSIVIAYCNLGSRNIALGTGALTAAVVGFVLQLVFDLQPSTKIDQVSFAYTTDFGDHEIRQWDYTKVMFGDGTVPRAILDPTSVLVQSRISLESEAGRWLFTQQGGNLEQRLAKITSDLSIFSLVASLCSAGGDWQWQFRRYNSPTMSFGSLVPLSTRDQCSTVSGAELRRQLSSAGNLFATFPQGLRDICLPAGTTIAIDANSVALSNRVVQIVFTLEETGQVGGDHMEPPPAGRAQPVRLPKLAGGSFRYDTRVKSFIVRTSFSRWRAYAKVKPTYEAWSNRLSQLVKAWFACC